MQSAAGVLGGLGPMATVYFMERVIDRTDSPDDQGHVPMLVWNDPSVPDRTAYLTGSSDADPLPAMIAGAQALERAGVSFIAMPCNTAHYFYDVLDSSVGIPFLHIVTETLDEAARRVPGLHTVGILATDGTVRTGTYQQAAEAAGLTCLVPDDEVQAEVMAMIYAGVKAGVPVERSRLAAAVEHLRERGAQAVLLACTELSILQRDVALWDADVVDSVDALARATVLASGRRLRDLSGEGER